MSLDIDFNQARTKHMFFKTKVRGYLLGSDANVNSFQTYLNELGDWIDSLSSKYNLRLTELMEANYLYNDLVEKTGKLIKLRTSGNESQAKEKFTEIEATGNKFLNTLSNLEKQVKQL